jgi:hypothetical protein
MRKIDTCQGYLTEDPLHNKAYPLTTMTTQSLINAINNNTSKAKKITKTAKTHRPGALFTQYTDYVEEDGRVKVHDENFISMEVEEPCINGQHQVNIQVEGKRDEKFVEPKVFMTCLGVAQVLTFGDCGRHRKAKRLCDHKDFDSADQCRKRRKVEPEVKCSTLEVTPAERHCLQVEEDMMINDTFCSHISDYVPIFKERQPTSCIRTKQTCALCIEDEQNAKNKK